MWRDADIEARDLKSNTLIAREARSIYWLLRGCERCSESVGFSAPRLARLRRDARWHRRDLHDTTAGASGQRRNEVSFVGHHISATFELCAGVVKAEARRVERSESLDNVEQSSTLVM